MIFFLIIHHNWLIYHEEDIIEYLEKKCVKYNIYFFGMLLIGVKMCFLIIRLNSNVPCCL